MDLLTGSASSPTESPDIGDGPDGAAAMKRLREGHPGTLLDVSEVLLSRSGQIRKAGAKADLTKGQSDVLEEFARGYDSLAMTLTLSALVAASDSPEGLT